MLIWPSGLDKWMDKELSEKLQLTADLTLEKAVEMVRHSEQIKGQVSQQANSGSGDATFLSEVAYNYILQYIGKY